ncbi:MAG: hypothetical protein ACXW30_02770 [Micavibrio sp.]
MSSIPLLSPARCVLIIGDEALYVYDSGAKTRLIDTIPWTAKEFEDTVVDLIKRECKGKPLLVLNDMTDQHFKGGQRIPKVGPMDRANVLQRKLTVAFPNYPIRGALPVKDKASKSVASSLKANASGGLYLFAAVPMSEPVAKTLTAVKQSMSSIAGFVLLPIESSDMVKALAEKAMKREKTKSRWAVLIGQHMGGGLRQVITRDGQLAMTRMTPISDMEVDPTAWANDVVQEFKATISYLSRFGYSPDDGTEVFVIATPSAGEDIRNQIDVPCNFTSYTVTEAAEVLGFRIGPQDDQYHADPLHVAWAGRKTRFILPMEATDIKKIYGPRQAAMVAGLLLFGGAAYLAWQLMSMGQGLLVVRDDLASQKRLQIEVEAEYQTELARMQALGFDVKLIQSSLNTFKALEDENIHPLPLFQDISEALGAELRLDKLIVNRIPATGASTIGPDGLEQKPAPTLQAVLTLSFPPSLDPEYGVRQINDLSRRLTTSLPEGYAVDISKQVDDLVVTENTVGEVGASGQTERVEDYKAEITIRGPL